jgi:hypothetical protein
MGWIDDLARWAAGPEDGAPVAPGPKVSRRGALALFGGTVAAAATGTLGDPEPAEAIVRCCDPNHNGTWSCLDGYECCCYTVAGGGGHSECCDSASGETCQDLPGQTDRGAQVRACCYTVCAHDCCTQPDEVCNSQGFCFSCGEFATRCGDDCCTDQQTCLQGRECVPKCAEGQTLCSKDRCCAPDEDCVSGGCQPKCEAGAVRCGDDEHCCEPGQKCQDNVCVNCVAPETECGDSCCRAGETCCDPDRQICCAAPRTCQDEFLTCVCPDGSCICNDQCCGDGEHCTVTGCAACPSGTVSCGNLCCPAGATCHIADYTGSVHCRGVCQCDSGGVLCGDRCCGRNDTCVDGVCHPCPAGAQACVDHCCDPPYECQGNRCTCPGETCGETCCDSDEECVGGRCLPRCDELGVTDRCGDGCCIRPDVCIGGVCRPCPKGSTHCGPVCCEAGTECYATGICRPVAAKLKPPASVTVEHGSATLTVTCTGGCSGTVTLETVTAHATMLGTLTRRPRRVVLGRARFKVPRGRHSAKAHVHLSAAGRRYLAKHHGTLKVQALVKTKGARKAFLSHAFKLKGSRPRRKR